MSPKISNVKNHAFTLIEMMIVILIIGILAALTLGISSSVMRNAEIHKTEDILKLLTMSLQEWEIEKGRMITFGGFSESSYENGQNYDIPLGSSDSVYTDGIVDPPFSTQGVTDADMLNAMRIRMEDLVVLLKQSEASTGILSKINPDHFCKTIGLGTDVEHTSDVCRIGSEHQMVVIDSWGTPIGVVYPGGNYFEANPGGNPAFDPAYDDVGDQTLRDEAEDGLGSCINARLYFVSAGPDQKWGYRFQSNNLNAGPGKETPPGSGIFLWEDSVDNIYSYEPFLVEHSH